MLEIEVNLTSGVSGIFFTRHPNYDECRELPGGILLSTEGDTERDALWESLLTTPDRLVPLIEILTGKPLVRPQTVVLHAFKWTYKPRGEHEAWDVTVEFT